MPECPAAARIEGDQIPIRCVGENQVSAGAENPGSFPDVVQGEFPRSDFTGLSG